MSKHKKWHEWFFSNCYRSKQYSDLLFKIDGLPDSWEEDFFRCSLCKHEWIITTDRFKDRINIKRKEIPINPPERDGMR